MAENKDNYYSLKKALSYNAFFNIIVGGRSIGKTYNITKSIIKRALRNGTQFAYVRRTEDDTRISSSTFFQALIAAGEFPEYDFKVAKDKLTRQFTFLAKKKNEKKFKLIGWAFQLSKAQSYKSTNYPLITDIFMDEFIKEKGFSLYLPDEAQTFLGLVTTIIRNADQMDKAKVFMSANAVALINPYFTYWGIDEIDVKQEFHFDKKRNMLIQFPQTTLAAINDTNPLIALTQNTQYGEYAINNMFKDNTLDLIIKKIDNKKFMYSIKIDDEVMAVYRTEYLGESIVYIDDVKHSESKIYSFNFDEIKENDTIYHNGFKTTQLNYLAAAAGNNVVYFSKVRLREKFKKIIRGLML